MGEGIIMFWTIFGGILVMKVKMEKIMTYNYGLDHRELGEHFFVLTVYNTSSHTSVIPLIP